MSSTIAIIPARGGSKRIPRKNVAPFLGRPMISYPITTAQESGLFDRILVSTDDEEIMAIVQQFGAEAPFLRPAELSRDDTPTSPVVLHALDWLETHNCLPDFVCCLYPTALFVTANDLRRSLDVLQESGATTAFSVVKYSHPIWRAMKMNADGRVELLWSEHSNTRTQDLSETFHDAGQFYWAATAKYRAAGWLFTADSVPVFLDNDHVQDIDTPEDWQHAESLYRLRNLDLTSGALS